MPYTIHVLYSLLHLDIWIENFQRQPAFVRGARIFTNGERFTTYLSPLAFGFLHLALPLMYGDGTLYPTLLLALAFCPASYVVSLLFQVAHISRETEDYIGGADTSRNDWAEEQIASSRDYAGDSLLACHITGGLNLQLEHHLFPSIPHPLLPTVRNTMKNIDGLDYPDGYPTFTAAVRAHFDVIRSKSKRP